MNKLFPGKNDDILVNKRNEAWLPIIKESVDNHCKTTIFVGAAHLAGLIKSFKDEGTYKIEKYSYYEQKFVEC